MISERLRRLRNALTVIVERVPSVDPPGRILRVLDCYHVVYEPRGGRAAMAERAFCPRCAPKLARRKS